MNVLLLVERSEWIVISEMLIYNWPQGENITLANITLLFAIAFFSFCLILVLQAALAKDTPGQKLLNWPSYNKDFCKHDKQVKPIECSKYTFYDYF